MKQFLNSLLSTICIAFILTGCKKNNDSTSYETKINFTYNGQQYNRTSSTGILSWLALVQGTPLFVNFRGLVIDARSLLGGDIYITASNSGSIECAYLQPTGLNITGNCSDLKTVVSGGGNNPIDSVLVYWYESGNLNFSYTDCKAITVATIPGQKDCAISGTFDLTLTNKNNQKIKLMNGSFSGRIKRYP